MATTNMRICAGIPVLVVRSISRLSVPGSLPVVNYAAINLVDRKVSP